MKKVLYRSSKVVILLFIISTLSVLIAKSASNDLLGYTWSDTVGWLDMSASSSPSYAVTLNNDGTLTGYAWSDNVGWVSFNRAITGNPPSNDVATGTSATAKVNLVTGKVEGWARALTGCAGDMWDATNKICLASGPGSDNGVTTTSGAGSLTFSTTTISLDAQTGTLDQDITITNNTSATLPAVRATILNPSQTYSSPTYSGYAMPVVPYYLYSPNPNTGCALQPAAPFSPYYEFGMDSNGHYFFQSNFPLGPGQSVLIHAMYYAGCRVMPQITYSVSPANKIAEPVVPSGSTQVALSSSGQGTILGHTVNVIWWVNAVNNSYAVKYSDDGINWHVAYGLNNGPVITSVTSSSANQSEFVDFGVPETNSPASSSRQYKVFAFPTANYGQADQGTTSVPKLNTSTNNGWDGWISLSGTLYPSPDFSGNSGVTYSSTTGSFTGYGWGSDVVGWINFNTLTTVNAPKAPAPICTSLNATPSSVTQGNSFNLSWTTSNAVSCATKDSLNYTYSNATNSPSGITITPSGNLTYTLSCANTNTPVDTCSKSVSVPVTTIIVITPDNSGLWFNNDSLKRLTNVTTRPNRATKVNWDVTGLTGYGYTACYEKVSTATKTLGGWVDGAALPANTSPNTGPLISLINLPIGSHSMYIQCFDPTNTLNPVSTTTNTAKINVIPDTIREN